MANGGRPICVNGILLYNGLSAWGSQLSIAVSLMVDGHHNVCFSVLDAVFNGVAAGTPRHKVCTAALHAQPSDGTSNPICRLPDAFCNVLERTFQPFAVNIAKVIGRTIVYSAEFVVEP